MNYYDKTATPLDTSGPVSRSLLWAFHKSPYSWRYGNNKFVETPAMRLGTLIHNACLEPEKMDQYVVSPYDSFRTNEAKAWRDEQQSKGVTVVSEVEMIIADGAERAFNNHHLVPAPFDSEVEVFVDVMGTPCKGLIDIVPPDGKRLWDLKTTASIDSEQELVKKIIDRGYHWQAAMYLDMYNLFRDDSRDEFSFIFLSTSAPYEIAVITLDDEFIEAGREGYMNALMLWQSCVRTDSWPGAVNGDRKVSLPKWARKQQ